VSETEDIDCQHTLTAVGTYSNEASIEGSDGTGTKNSNKVEVEVPPEPDFTIEKLQEIAGSGEGFVRSQLTAEVGQTVDCEIVVRNTGNVPLTFSNFTDANCENVGGGLGAGSVAPKGAITYTCAQLLTTLGSYENSAEDTGTPPEGDGVPFSHTSNTVIVEVEKGRD
jgi:hypothetical protein